MRDAKKVQEYGSRILKVRETAILLSLLLTFVLIGGAKTSYAYPFIEVTGLADPGPAADNGDGSASLDVNYTFNVNTADYGYEMFSLSLEFESDVFKSVGLAYGIVPAGWSSSITTTSTGTKYEIVSTNPWSGPTLEQENPWDLRYRLMYTILLLLIARYGMKGRYGGSLGQRGIQDSLVLKIETKMVVLTMRMRNLLAMEALRPLLPTLFLNHLRYFSSAPGFWALGCLEAEK